MANKERECNVVITGLPEKSDPIGANDDAKIRRIFATIEVPDDVMIHELRRLGTLDSHRENPCRPLLMRLANRNMREEVMKQAPKLKAYKGEDEEQIKKIFIKWDTHPAWRKEHNRLRKLVKEERQKPCNSGTTIVYDVKRKVVTRDGQVIDRFTPQF